MFMALSDHSQTGRRLVVSGILIVMYFSFKIKTPGVGSGDNELVEFVEKYRKNEYVVKILGEEMTSFATIH
jgi:hypothetical protein